MAINPNDVFMNTPGFTIFVWLDGEPREDATAAATFGAPNQMELAKLLRCIGIRYAAEPGRQVRVSVYDNKRPCWVKPDGITAVDSFAAFAMELDVRCGNVRV